MTAFCVGTGTDRNSIERQRDLAANIVALNGSIAVYETGKRPRHIWDYAEELARLVLEATTPTD